MSFQDLSTAMRSPSGNYALVQKWKWDIKPDSTLSSINVASFRNDIHGAKDDRSNETLIWCFTTTFFPGFSRCFTLSCDASISYTNLHLPFSFPVLIWTVFRSWVSFKATRYLQKVSSHSTIKRARHFLVSWISKQYDTTKESNSLFSYPSMY